MWPKLVQFLDGQQFFVLTRYFNEHITVFVRLVTLPVPSDSELNQLLKYSMVYGKEKENKKKSNMNDMIVIDSESEGNDDDDDMDINDDEMGFEFMSNGEKCVFAEYFIELKIKSLVNGNVIKSPLRWPAQLYSVCVPFTFEDGQSELLTIGRKVFERYWIKNKESGSAVLRFSFEVHFTQ